jgi:hypothetical protein
MAVVNNDGVVVMQSTYADAVDAMLTNAEADAVIATTTATAAATKRQVSWYVMYGMRKRAAIDLGWHRLHEAQGMPHDYKLIGTDELAQPKYKVVELGARMNGCEHLRLMR